MSLKLQILVLVGLIASTSFADEGIEIYRSYRNGDHLYSTDRNEGPRAGYQNEGLAFIVSAERSFFAQTAIYRCYTGRKHFVSTDRNCEGQRREGRYGFISESPMFGFVALNRYYNRRSGDHLITTDENSENLSGFVFEGTLGYAIPGNF